MNPTPDTTTTAGNGDNFHPQQAAALLDQTTQQTRRRLEPAQPWLLVIRGVAVLAVFGAVWLNVRRQHPYQHPTAAGGTARRRHAVLHSPAGHARAHSR